MQWFILLVLSVVMASSALGDERPMVSKKTLEPGTRINPKSLPPGKHLAIRTRPKLVSGDVEKLRKPIRSSVESFTTLVLIESERHPTMPTSFRCGAVYLGLGRPEEPEDVVLTKASADRLGVDLGFVEGKVLAAREKELAEVKLPGSTETMALFDFRTVLLQGAEHVGATLRYAALVDPENGTVATAYWVLDSTENNYRFRGKSIRLLPANYVMDWELHVDGSKISLGTPRWDAFAATRLPEGTDLLASAELKAAAAVPSYTAESARELERQLRNLLGRPRYEAASTQETITR